MLLLFLAQHRPTHLYLVRVHLSLLALFQTMSAVMRLLPSLLSLSFNLFGSCHLIFIDKMFCSNLRTGCFSLFPVSGARLISQGSMDNYSGSLASGFSCWKLVASACGLLWQILWLSDYWPFECCVTLLLVQLNSTHLLMAFVNELVECTLFVASWLVLVRFSVYFDHVFISHCLKIVSLKA